MPADVPFQTLHLGVFYINDGSREQWLCGQTSRDHFITQSKETNYIRAEQNSLIQPSQAPQDSRVATADLRQKRRAWFENLSPWRKRNFWFQNVHMSEKGDGVQMQTGP